MEKTVDMNFFKNLHNVTDDEEIKKQVASIVLRMASIQTLEDRTTLDRVFIFVCKQLQAATRLWEVAELVKAAFAQAGYPIIYEEA